MHAIIGLHAFMHMNRRAYIDIYMLTV